MFGHLIFIIVWKFMLIQFLFLNSVALFLLVFSYLFAITLYIFEL